VYETVKSGTFGAIEGFSRRKCEIETFIRGKWGRKSVSEGPSDPEKGAGEEQVIEEAEREGKEGEEIQENER
jgi:hypothetical protein